MRENGRGVVSASSYIFQRVGIENFASPKVPRQCLFVLMVQVAWREGEALRSENVRASEWKWNRKFNMSVTNFDIRLGRIALG
jgi:hypothetical protein